MKPLLLLLVACNAFSYSYAQLAQLSERRNDTLLEKRIQKISLHENQFFNTENRDFFTLFTVIPDSLLKNKDSLIQESSHLYKKILTAIGKERENENIDIAYIGQQSDGYNFGLEYTNGRYKGNVTYSLSPNTLLAPNDNVKQRLTGLVGNKYVRHELRKDGLSIVFEVILKDASIMTHKLAERDAIRFLVTYLDNQYREYSTLKIIYIDQYTGEAFRYNVKIDELILISLSNYLLVPVKKNGNG